MTAFLLAALAFVWVVGGWLLIDADDADRLTPGEVLVYILWPVTIPVARSMGRWQR